MTKPMTAEDVLPLVSALTPKERVRLLRLMTEQPGANDAAVYAAVPPKHDAFSSDEEALAWEVDGWEDVD
jgi:hypothetical protein